MRHGIGRHLYRSPSGIFGPIAPSTVEYLVVAGGGGGGSTNSAGGGGAGGFRTATNFSVSASAPLTITVGAGGGPTTAGSDSVFSTITSIGGGRGASGPTTPTTGGSGGGSAEGVQTGAAGTAGQGNAGGTHATDATCQAGGGGGGASAVGANGNAPSALGGNGGAGTASSITGVSVTYAGGGGGSGRVLSPGVNNGKVTGGSGGSGGGGAAGNVNYGTSTVGINGTSGTANTGGGGGASGGYDNLLGTAGYGSAGSGGSGIVVIAYPNTYANISNISAGLTYTLDTVSRPGYKVYKFTAGTGTIQFSNVASLDFNFLTGTLDPSITFTRASSATYFDSTGTLQTAGNNVARFDYNPSTLAAQGLLIEEQRTNLQTYSELFDNAAWTKSRSSITVNATTAPNNSITGDKLVEDTATGSHDLNGSVITPTIGATYTISCFAKSGERTFCRIGMFQNATPFAYASAIVNLADLTVNTSLFSPGGQFSGLSATATSAGKGWVRIVVTATYNVSDGLRSIIGLATNATTFSYTGDGTSGLFIWGTQLEAGAFATSYIPTTSAAATRSADVASVNTLTPWFNASEGTLFAQGRLVGGTAATYPSMAGLVGANANNDSTQLQWTANSGGMRFGVRNGGVAQADVSFGASKTANSPYKIAGAYKTNDVNAASDGVIGTQDTSVSLPTITSLSIGGSVAFQPVASTWISRVTYYPTRLPDATLQALTT